MKAALQAGDVKPATKSPIDWLAGGRTTAEWWDRYGPFSYWNYGPPDQPRAEALAAAAEQLRYGDDQVTAHSVPAEVLDIGLVYLRASIYPTEARHGRAGGGAPVDDDRQHQLDEMMDAMRRVVTGSLDRPDERMTTAGPVVLDSGDHRARGPPRHPCPLREASALVAPRSTSRGNDFCCRLCDTQLPSITTRGVSQPRPVRVERAPTLPCPSSLPTGARALRQAAASPSERLVTAMSRMLCRVNLDSGTAALVGRR